MLESMRQFLTGAFFQSLGRAMRQEDAGEGFAWTWIYGPEHHASGTAYFSVKDRARETGRMTVTTGYFTGNDGSVIGFVGRLDRP